MPKRSDGEETRNRILTAAAEVFGKNGYRGATNQEISRKSGANSAAISYYFGDKPGLYRETWRFLQEKSAAKYAAWLEPDAAANNPERLPLKGVSREMELARLKRLCRSIFDWMQDEECWDSEILRYEITESNGILDNPVQDLVVWPVKQEIMKSLARLLHVAGDSLTVILGAQGIVARFREGFQLDCADLARWSLEECFVSIYSSFLKSVGLQETKNTQELFRKSSNETEHPELGVTDEVDEFALKPMNMEDVLLMKKAEQLEKKACEPKEEIKPESAGGDAPGYYQQELW